VSDRDWYANLPNTSVGHLCSSCLLTLDYSFGTVPVSQLCDDKGDGGAVVAWTASVIREAQKSQFLTAEAGRALSSSYSEASEAVSPDSGIVMCAATPLRVSQDGHTECPLSSLWGIRSKLICMRSLYQVRKMREWRRTLLQVSHTSSGRSLNGFVAGSVTTIPAWTVSFLTRIHVPAICSCQQFVVL
jgi:hypothetical protein